MGECVGSFEKQRIEMVQELDGKTAKDLLGSIGATWKRWCARPSLVFFKKCWLISSRRQNKVLLWLEERGCRLFLFFCEYCFSLNFVSSIARTFVELASNTL